MGINTKDKPKRSIKLKDNQIDYLMKVLVKHPTQVAASLALGVSKDVLDRTIKYGSCSEVTYRILFPDADIPEAS